MPNHPFHAQINAFLACLLASGSAFALTSGYQIASPGSTTTTTATTAPAGTSTAGALTEIPSTTKPPLPSSDSAVEQAPSASSSGGTPSNSGSTTPGTSSNPVRNFERTSAIGQSFGNAHFNAFYSSGLSFFGGRTAQLVGLKDCSRLVPLPSSANDYDNGEAAIEACLDEMSAAGLKLTTDCAASNRDIEECMTDPAFRSAHQQQVSQIGLEMEQRILRTTGWLEAGGKVLGFSVPFVDISLSGRSSASQSPRASIDYFVRNQEVYHASGAGLQTYDKTTDSLLYENDKVYMIGGVIPLTLHVEASGHTGITFQANAAPSSTSVGVTPHARVDGMGSVKLDLLLYAGGVQLDLEFIDVQVPSTASLSRTQYTGHDRLAWNVHSDLVLHSLAGKVQLFGKPVWRKQYDYRSLLSWNGFGTTIPIYDNGGYAYTKKPLLPWSSAVRPTLAFSFAALPLAGLLALGAGAAAPAAPPARQEPVLAPVEGAPQARFVAGHGRLYDAKLSSRSLIHVSPERPQVILLEAAGKLSVRVLSATQGQVELLFALEAPRVEAGDGQQKAPASTTDELARAAALPFAVRLDPRGKIQQLRFRERTSTVSRGLLKALAASMQLAAPETPAAAWASEEQDSTGAFVARYLRTGSDQIERSWSGYTALASGRGLVPAEQAGAKEGGGRVLLLLDARRWPLELAGTSALRQEPGGGLPPSEGNLTVQLRLERALDGEAPAAFEQEPGDIVSTLDRVEADPRVKRPEGSVASSLSQLTRSLAETPREQGGKRARDMVALKNLFREDPAAVADIRGQILRGAPGVMAKPALGALGAAGTPQAQRALADVASSERIELDQRTDAVIHLGLSPSPTLDSITSMEKLSQRREPEVRDAARLALGNQTRSLLLAGNTDDAAEPLRHLFEAYQEAQTPEEKALILRALGNSGARAVLPLAQSAAFSPSAELRAAAAVAARQIDDPRADVLLDQLLRDGDPDVRLAAVAALGSRPLPAHVPALTRTLTEDESTAVRRRVIDLLHRQLPAPEAAALLALVTQGDASPELRALAASL